LEGYCGAGEDSGGLIDGESSMIDVLVIGGGNAALCAALTAREAGASVLLLEASPREWRGGNSVHTRNIRCSHDEPQDVLTGEYSEEEHWQDLLKVTGGLTTEHLTWLVLRESKTCRAWMKKHGVRFQNSLSGTLHLSRTNAFFLGGGKALVNAYYRSAERLGVQIRYDSAVTRLEIAHTPLVPPERGDVSEADRGEGARFVAAYVGAERIEARTCVVASGGFESNLDWLREAWGRNERGEYPSDNFLIRGTRFNQGVMLKALLAAGADQIGDPTQAHMVAIDARAPLYDGGIATRVDAVSLGIVVNKDGERFYDEGEDFWPKRYAIWGRLVAQQRGQTGYVIIDKKMLGKFMPPVFEGTTADSVGELADKLGLPRSTFETTVANFNAACSLTNGQGTFNHEILDDCTALSASPPKTHWAQPLLDAPFTAYALQPGITFTYLGVKVNEQTSVHFANQPSPNLFAAGEVMAGNVLGKGYLAGVGMTIGTVFGLIAGREAAKKAKL
jgi:tricarballylate dehydrogenase